MTKKKRNKETFVEITPTRLPSTKGRNKQYFYRRIKQENFSY